MTSHSLFRAGGGGGGGSFDFGPTQLVLHPRRMLQTSGSSVITHFQTSHGFSAGQHDTTNTNLNDTSDFVFGTQSAKVVTLGNAAFVTLTRTAMTSVDTTGKNVRVWVKTPDPTRFASLLLLCGSSGLANRYSWDLSKPPYQTGAYIVPANEWTPLTLSFADAFVTGTPVRTAVTDWRVAMVDANGLPATVHVGGIDLVPATSAKYPNGVVTINFDDSYIGHWNVARPILNTYSYPATLFPIADVIGASGAYMTTANLRALQDNLGWEVAPHAYASSTHSGFNSMTTSAIQADIEANIEWMRTNGLYYQGSYAYPLGTFSGGQDAAVAPYVRGARTIHSLLRHNPLPTANPLRIRSSSGVGGSGGTGVTTFTNANGILDKCLADKSWVNITLHDVVSGTTSNINMIGATDLTNLCAGIASRGIAVATMSEVMASIL